MGGVIITLLFALGMEGFGRLLFGRWMKGLDLYSRTGIAGMLGLGTCGLLTLFIGLLPQGLVWGVGIVAVMSLVGYGKLIRDRFWTEPFIPRKPVSLEWLFVVAIAIACLFELVAVLAPSGSLDWDTIAYHLAIPKMWLKAGHIYPIVFISHSNFPLSVDNLYIWGLYWGGQAGAKAFELSFYIFGIYAVFGLARQRYGLKAAAWAALAFATVPAITWEAGSGYIDVAHGLFTACGVYLAIWALDDYWSTESPISEDKSSETSASLWPLAGICLGFAAGSKYTGLQAFIALAVVLGGYALIRIRGKGVGRVAAILGIAAAVCATWYVKNILWVGNPVYPFFYEQFGGKNWAEFNAKIYKDQQQIFGIPRKGPAAGFADFPDSVMGLAFQPSRYTDPNPVLVNNPGQEPSGADGLPFAAIGAAVIASGFVWLFSGEIRRFEGLLLGFIGFSFLMWFVLSQQSRYAISFAPILAILLGAGVARLRAGPILAFVAGVQAIATLGLIYNWQFKDQIPVVTGKVSESEYLSQHLGPYKAFTWLNQNVKSGTVALYDEVFGFYLDVPYFWANPGHCTVIGYDNLQNGEQFAHRLKQLGLTTIYIAHTDHWDEMLKALGFAGPIVALPSDLAKSYAADPQTKYKWLLTDAAQKGLIVPEQGFASGVVMRVR